MLPSDLVPTLAADAVLRAVVRDAVADPGRTAVLAPQRDVRDVDRHLLVDDAALHDLAARLRVLLDEVDAVDDHLVAVGVDARDRAPAPDVLAGEHDDLVTLLDANLRHLENLRRERHDPHEAAVAQLASD